MLFLISLLKFFLSLFSFFYSMHCSGCSAFCRIHQNMKIVSHSIFWNHGFARWSYGYPALSKIYLPIWSSFSKADFSYFFTFLDSLHARHFKPLPYNLFRKNLQRKAFNRQRIPEFNYNPDWLRIIFFSSFA